MNIHLHIDRIVLEGLPVRPNGRQQLGSAIEAELMRLLAENGLPPEWGAGGAVPMVRGGDLSLPVGNSSRELGAEIAHSIYGSIGGLQRATDDGQRNRTEMVSRAVTEHTREHEGIG